MIMKFMPLLVLTCAITTLKGQSAQDYANVYKDLQVFETPLAEKLRKGIKKSDLAKIQNPQIKEVALSILQNKYDNHYRLANYSALLNPDALGGQLMIGDGYSKYENMTGIYLPIGRHIVSVDHIDGDKTIKLVIPNWNRHAPEGTDPTKDPKGWGIIKQEFKLRNGVNIIDVKDFDGLAYIDYFSDEPTKETPISVHFIGSQVNGYFDIRKNNDQDWNNLVDHAVYPIVDAKGKHIQIAYPAADIKKYAYGKGVELISNYDSLISRQHRIMGLIKYNKVPDNKILARVNYNYYMFRDGDGVAYMGTNPGNAMPLVVDPARVIKGDPCWGFSHEVGHVHQLRPYFNWGGLGEVSNNIFSLYVTTSYGNKSRASELGSYKKSRESIINGKISYLQDADVFNRLVPFWQLQLYFTSKGNNPSFYPDLFEKLRTQESEQRNTRGEWAESRGSNPAVYQLNFIKTACEVSKTDLTDFFNLYGFFYVGKFTYDDYGKYDYEMTQEMVNTCKQEIEKMKFPKPKIDISTLED
ncbi:M60 family metallopeptidase [Sphingobacterium sp. SRCM116780]|uniref:M60 family metallopeptidase n=1 Tax=Sphingobacterium sp. SRCM116780 TaxID=2907623 RepID=UPI001F29F299|nr:M60 family metallopeptidase [Sphingobacterium sp. SRCM116780]UIR54524.1 M60 family metallopeptidase [Sphingobacterium sp. SRCM116780]